MEAIRASRLAPGFSVKIVENNKKRWARPGEREKLSERNRQMWANPETKKKISAAISRVNGTPEKREFYSRLRALQWATDPEYRRKVIEGVCANHQTPEAREMFSDLLSARWEVPEFRAKMVASIQRNARTPESRARVSARTKERWTTDEQFRKTVLDAARIYRESPEAIAALSERMKGLWADPLWKQRQQALIAETMMSKGLWKTRRGNRHLSAEEIEEIRECLRQGFSMRTARWLTGFTKPTVQRYYLIYRYEAPKCLHGKNLFMCSSCVGRRRRAGPDGKVIYESGPHKDEAA